MTFKIAIFKQLKPVETENTPDQIVQELCTPKRISFHRCGDALQWEALPSVHELLGSISSGRNSVCCGMSLTPVLGRESRRVGSSMSALAAREFEASWAA